MAGLASSALLLLAAGCNRGAVYGKPIDRSPAESKRVLVVINDPSLDSKEIGEYYVEKRNIPSRNVVRINVSMSDNVSLDEYKFGIEAPVRRAIERSENKIDFIVVTKGVPLRLQDDSGYSVDAFLAAMKLEGVKPIERLDEASIRAAQNPYFRKNEPFSSEKFGMYLVTRLDGVDVADAKRLVDLSLAAKPAKGPFFFDAAANRKDGPFLLNQQQMYRASELLKAKGFASRLDEKPEFVAPPEPVMGYVSWGSNDAAFSEETYKKIRFLPGAISETFVSTSGRNFREFSEGQSRIVDLIRGGVTGVKGYVSEPYTFALAEPDVLFDRYTSGYNLAESFYMASRVVKWKDIVVGDPLCSPYAKEPAASPG